MRHGLRSCQLMPHTRTPLTPLLPVPVLALLPPLLTQLAGTR